MRRRLLGVSLTALTTLLLELVLARVFDVILIPSMAYIVITCAVFAYGLAGLYVAVRPLRWRSEESLPRLAALSAAAMLLVRPVMNRLPFDFTQIPEAPVKQLVSFGVAYLVLFVPFFLSGVIITTLFSRYARDIRRLYAWDLVGAALGCVTVVPLLPAIGPGGLLILAAGLSLLASALFSRGRRWIAATTAGGVVLVVVPYFVPPARLDFRQHTEKQLAKEAQAAGRIEFSRWDPLAKIDVYPFDDPMAPGLANNRRWHVAYDGGNQSTTFYRFNGDFAALRARIEQGTPGAALENFWQRGALASHRLKRDTGSRVLIIGSGGGQETKGALMYGASHVDAVELVATVVELARGRYAGTIGNIFNDPRVAVHVAEGRSFLRASDERYDIIQIFSNNAPSNLSKGIGAMDPTYLQTADAYREYFTHLKSDGILHINYQLYPRMISTAALAWRQLGRTDFHRHVLVFEQPARAYHPTLMIKMQPWTPEEVDELRRFFNADSVEGSYAVVVNPVGADHNFLSEDFFTGDFPAALAARLAYHATPRTDDRPFFNVLRKRIAPIKPDSAGFVSEYTAKILNNQLKRGWVPMDLVHLFVTGVVSLLFMLLTIAIPLRYAPIGRGTWAGKFPTLAYFACLGSGFIILELVLIQIFLRLVGSPLYTYSVVIFVLLLAAGLGSFASERLGVGLERRWTLPFGGVLSVGTLLLVIHEPIFHTFLAAPLLIRVLVAAALIFPLGFFLGMPFPLGVLMAGRLPEGVVAWGWALNGVFTVAGGLLTVLLSISLGFRATMVVALAIYGVAFALFAVARRLAPPAERVALGEPDLGSPVKVESWG